MLFLHTRLATIDGEFASGTRDVAPDLEELHALAQANEEEGENDEAIDVDLLTRAMSR